MLIRARKGWPRSMSSMLVWALLGCLVAVAPLHAEPPPEADTASQANANEVTLNATLQAAVRAYEQGNLERARLLFEQAHAEAPTARTLRSLALVAFRQQRFEEAAALFEAALASSVKPLTEALRADALKLSEEARGRLSSAAPVQVVPGAAPPAPGAAAALHEPTVPPAPALVQQPSPTTTAPVSGLSPRAERDHRSGRLKRAGYATAAVSATALIGSGIALGIGLKRLNAIEDVCRAYPDGQCDASEVRAREHAARLDLLSALSIAGVALAAASAATSGTLWLLHYRQRAGQHHAELELRVRF
jgi:tetratricopeptide (TPR) repeat protein